MSLDRFGGGRQLSLIQKILQKIQDLGGTYNRIVRKKKPVRFTRKMAALKKQRRKRQRLSRRINRITAKKNKAKGKVATCR